ncbi:hypothetical protein DD237_004616 [Peronospora effusa]|uniref:Uncharacterized protein n=1 Tax=Peronospora effusa TaxID=542832 RepID=A0A3R7XP32_9STRA|nr:hypothetical protein DD237_004616 [Peronospora effusa]
MARLYHRVLSLLHQLFLALVDSLKHHYRIPKYIPSVTVQVDKVHSTVTTSLSSICTKAEECFVDETSSKVCNRLKKNCNQCVIEKENDSVFSALTRTEYICLDVDDNGDCPTGTTKCPTRLKTSDDEKELEPEENTQSSYTDPDESSKTIPTFASTEKKLISSSSESKLPVHSNLSSLEATPTIENSSTEKKPTIPLLSTDPSGNTPTSETPKKPTPTKTSNPVAKSSTSEEEVLEDASTGGASTSSLHESVSTSKGSNFPPPDAAGTYEAKKDKSNNPDQSSISSAVSPTVTTRTDDKSTTQDTVTTPTDDKSVTRDTALSNKSDASTTANHGSTSDSKLGLILCIGLGAAAVVGFAGFVVWRKKADDEDSDAGFSPNKPDMSRNVVSQPSATSVSTAYLAQPSKYGNNNYEYRYSNNYGNNYGGDNGYSNNRAVARYVTGSTVDSAAGRAPSYGSPCSIDMDGGYDSRRTDSILGGTGVILSTKSGMQFSAGPSPSNSDTNQDMWGNEMGSVRQKCTASCASVEF